jgi:hypothetical protein
MHAKPASSFVVARGAPEQCLGKRDQSILALEFFTKSIRLVVLA